MSYRTFKRVLGETNLERKCRWWFGISLFVMLSLSFTWYGRETNKLVEKNIQEMSKEYVRAGWQTLHIKSIVELESPDKDQADRLNLTNSSTTIWPRAVRNWARASNGRRFCSLPVRTGESPDDLGEPAARR